jgi:hypothetical protein
MTGHVVIFNSPPSGGKDTFGEMLREAYRGKKDTRFVHREMKTKLFYLTCQIYGVQLQDWFERYNVPGLKEEPWEELDGISQRKALQIVSEKVIKPVYGNDYFGKMSARTLREDTKCNYYYTDGGFKEELAPIIDKVGADNVLIIRLHREGYTFEGDTRSYIADSWFPEVKMVDVESGDKAETFEEILKEVTQKW